MSIEYSYATTPEYRLIGEDGTFYSQEEILGELKKAFPGGFTSREGTNFLKSLCGEHYKVQSLKRYFMGWQELWWKDHNFFVSFLRIGALRRELSRTSPYYIYFVEDR